MKRYKAVIYDIDGTILDTLKMNMIPLMKIIEEETGEKITYEEVLKYAAAPGKRTLTDLKIKDVEKTYTRWVKYVNEYAKGAKLYDGFEKVFTAFEGKIIQAIASSKTVSQYQIDFVEKGLDKYIQVAILADDTKKHKPDPEPLFKCLDSLKIKPQEAIFIGDSYSDYLAAKSANIDFGYAMWGSVSGQGIEEPEYTFRQPIELLKLIDQE